MKQYAKKESEGEGREDKRLLYIQLLIIKWAQYLILKFITKESILQL